MNRDCAFYICPTCFAVSEKIYVCHGHRMIKCDAVNPADSRRRPIMTEEGLLKSHAPRWFLEGVKALRLSAF